MWTWWAEFTMRSRIDSATTGFGNSVYQSEAARVWASYNQKLWMHDLTMGATYPPS